MPRDCSSSKKPGMLVNRPWICGSGTTSRTGMTALPVEYPQQLINTGAADLHYLVVNTMDFPDLSEYPDSNKVGAFGRAAVADKVGLRKLFVRG